MKIDERKQAGHDTYHKHMDPLVKIALYIPLAVASAVAYDYCYRNAHVHVIKCAILGFLLAFVTGTWGSSLFTPWFTVSQVLFGLAGGLVLAISFVFLARWRLRSSRPL